MRPSCLFYGRRRAAQFLGARATSKDEIMSIPIKNANTIIGTEANDSLQGTATADTILGLGGNDNLYGEGGDDLIDAGAGNDFIMPTATAAYGAYGQDIVLGGEGDDLINYNFSTVKATIDGGEGTDNLFGGSAADMIDGGAGDDRIGGNAGGDTMSGGSGSDTFLYYGPGETGMTALTADRITDFTSGEDALDMPVLSMYYLENHGGGHIIWDTYDEATIAYGAGFEAAREAAGEMLYDRNYHGRYYAFVTDGVDGYLFADLDRNGQADTAVILDGLTSTTQFQATDIV
jgi:hypothetical protein